MSANGTNNLSGQHRRHDHVRVTVRGDHPVALAAAVPWTIRMYTWLAALAAATRDAGGAMPGMVPADTTADDVATDDAGAAAPVSAVHDTPMVRVTGRRGPFWSCHRKGADGRFCSYRTAHA